jgi:hypothetical protein
MSFLNIFSFQNYAFFIREDIILSKFQNFFEGLLGFFEDLSYSAVDWASWEHFFDEFLVKGHTVKKEKKIFLICK